MAAWTLGEQQVEVDLAGNRAAVEVPLIGRARGYPRPAAVKIAELPAADRLAGRLAAARLRGVEGGRRRDRQRGRARQNAAAAGVAHENRVEAGVRWLVTGEIVQGTNPWPRKWRCR